MVRVLTVCAVVASILVVPAMCMGGVLTHACQCTSEIACACESTCGHSAGAGRDSECGDESGCGHERGCPDDPCSVGVVRPDRQDSDVVSTAPPADTTDVTASPSRFESVRTLAIELPCVRKLPFPPSDLPLLI